jgi:hypothetical protein
MGITTYIEYCIGYKNENPVIDRRRYKFQMCMIIMQMFPVAVTCGNTFILKPSEKDPGNFFLIAVVYLDLTPSHGT